MAMQYNKDAVTKAPYEWTEDFFRVVFRELNGTPLSAAGNFFITY